MIGSTKIFVGLFSHRMSLGVMYCISLSSWRCVYTLVLLQGPIVWHMAWLGFVGPESTRPCHRGYLPLALGQGDTGQGEEKKIHHPTPCPHKNESKLENNMQGLPNTGTLAICWCFLLHTVFAKLPLTACISNETLCPCGEGSKSVPVRTGTISPVWLL